MDISTVLCTYNNADRLRVTLQSLCEVAPPEGVTWELITVDNNSTDETETVVKYFCDQLPITHLFEAKQGKSCALNTGVENAQGDLIVFIDDDVKPAPNWLAAYWEAYQDRPEGYYFGGPIESEYEGEPPDADLLRAAFASVSGLDYGPEPCEKPEEGYFIGLNWACPAHHLEQVGPFDESIGLNPETGGAVVGGETDLMSRLENQGVGGWYVPGARLRHFVPASKATLEHIVSRKVATAVSNMYDTESSTPTTVLGLPLGLYKEAALHWADWVLRWVTGRMWKAEYSSWGVWAERVRACHRRGS